MSRRFGRYVLSVPYFIAALVVLNTLLTDVPLSPQRRSGGCTFFGGGRSVGGVAIGTDGVLKNMAVGNVQELNALRAKAAQEAVGDIAQPTPLRKISLRRLEEEIAKAQREKRPLSDTVKLLAGLQRIQYVFVYPEDQDIVIAGFGEGWKVDDRGNVVGATTGKPVLQLDDLIVALRSARAGRGEITCSIDPTPDGLQRLREYAATLRNIGDPDTTAHTIEQVLGQQIVSVHGVPDTSHFARILVAADYRMKRLGMGFDPAPVNGMPSYLQMIPAGPRGMQSMTPRWWLVPDYDPLHTDGQGLAWELRGGRVKALTEETFFGEQGTKSNTGKTNPIAQKWADNMTAKYEALSAKEPIFGELRNCMDMAIFAALVFKENLPAKAGYKLPLWLDGSQLPNEELIAAKRIDTQATLMRKGSNWVITASGGVQIQPFAIVSKTEKSDKLSSARGSREPEALKSWWWN
jgi:hypothetical protein